MLVQEYIDEAISRQKVKSLAALGRLLGVNRASVNFMYRDKMLPSEETMIRLAELAGLPKEEALIDLNIWRAKNNPELQKLWIRLSKMIGCFAVFPLILLMIPHGITFATIGGIMYIMLQIAVAMSLFFLFFYLLTKFSKLQVYEIA